MDSLQIDQDTKDITRYLKPKQTEKRKRLVLVLQDFSYVHLACRQLKHDRSCFAQQYANKSVPEAIQGFLLKQDVLITGARP